MKTVFIGEIIRQRRKELGLTQPQLCEGICDTVTLFRTERGAQTPSKKIMDSLLERLGLPSGKYYAFLTKEEEAVENLKKEIVSAEVFRYPDRVHEKLAELERVSDKDDPFTRQFILQYRMMFGRLKNGEIKPFSDEEKIDMLLEAVHLTCPSFDFERIKEGLYTYKEIELINHIALTYVDSGQVEKGLDIHRQLFEYLQDHHQRADNSAHLLPMIVNNYARDLTILGQYQQAVELAEYGWKVSVNYGYYGCLRGLLSTMAKAYHFIGDDEKSKDRYCQAYYMAKATDFMQYAEEIKAEAKKYLNIDLKF